MKTEREANRLEASNIAVRIRREVRRRVADRQSLLVTRGKYFRPVILGTASSPRERVRPVMMPAGAAD